MDLSAEDVENYYEGFSNDTLWPLYHDVVAPPSLPPALVAGLRPGQRAVRRGRRRGRGRGRDGLGAGLPAPAGAGPCSASAARTCGSGSSCTSPSRRSSCSSSCRGASRSSGGCWARTSSASTRRAVRATSARWRPGSARGGRGGHGDVVVPRPRRQARRLPHLDRLRGARRAVAHTRGRSRGPRRSATSWATRAGCCSASTGSTTPRASTCGCARSRSCSARQRISADDTVFLQIATPSRERVEHYIRLRAEIEQTVGRINGDHSRIGRPPVHYLHQSLPRDELTAFYLAADVMLVTPLRDGMNLVAKEYVACRHDDGGRAGALRVHRRGPRADQRAAGEPARHRRGQGGGGAGAGDAARRGAQADEDAAPPRASATTSTGGRATFLDALGLPT